jgi:V/A-type H+-transporting ATPase subunit I
MFAPRRDMSADEFFAARDESRVMELAAEVVEADGAIRRLDAEELRLGGHIESLAPWEGHGLPLDYEGTESAGLLLGAIPASTDFDKLGVELETAAPLAELFRVSYGKEQQYVCAVYARELRQEVSDVLRVGGFSASQHKGLGGTAAEEIAKTRESLAELQEERERQKARIAAASDRQAFEHILDLANTRLTEAEAADELFATERTVTLTGWIPARSEGALSDTLSKYICAWELRDPTEDETADVPIELHNNALTRPLTMVTEMYSFPAYDGVDPNPLMAPFFILFYGVMMADMGYGLLMILAALFVKRKKPRAGMRNFFDLMLMCGIATFIVGAVTGAFFGNLLTQFAPLVGLEFTLPYTPPISTMRDTTQLLIAALVVGFVQILTGMAIAFVKQTKDGDFLGALFDIGSWWLLFAGLGLGALGITWYVAIAGAVALVATQGRNSPSIIGKFVGGLASLYNITGYFGDVLSYARLMALMLAGGAVADAFNQIAAMPGNSIPVPFNIIVFLVIAVAGHLINIGLNLIGCFVHDLRLQCLEYFGKFYKDGGKAFSPMKIDAKYHNILAK